MKEPLLHPVPLKQTSARYLVLVLLCYAMGAR